MVISTASGTVGTWFEHRGVKEVRNLLRNAELFAKLLFLVAKQQHFCYIYETASLAFYSF
jgi:hypothetical protein